MLGLRRGMGLIPGPAQWVEGSSVDAASGFATAAWIQSLAQKLPYATGVAIKKIFFKCLT